MRGIIFLGNRKLEIGELPEPEVKKGDILVKVKTSAICGSEGETFIPQTGLPWRGNPGHEVMGIVEDPNGSKRFKKGDRVGVSTIQGCGECFWCGQGKQTYCKQAKVLKNAHSDYIVGKEMWMQPVPEDIDDATATLLAGDGLGVPFGATMRAGVRFGMTTCVFGVGPVGQSMVLLQTFLGARVIAVDINPQALKFAEEMGAWKTLNPNETSDLKGEIFELSRGIGPDVSFDACGNQEMFNLAMEVTMPGGVVMTVAHGHHGVDSVKQRLSFYTDANGQNCGRNLTLMGDWAAFYRDYTEQLSFVRNGLQIRKVITAEYPLERAAEAYEAYFSKGMRGKTILTR